MTGKSFILYTDAPAPFPVGSPLNDFLPNLLTPGVGPNTREIMKFVVGLHLAGSATRYNPPGGFHHRAASTRGPVERHAADPIHHGLI